jgi:transposase
MVAQLLAHIDTLDAALQNLTERIELALAPHAHIVELLCTIPGAQAHAAQVLIAECGLDMARFPTVGHFASWAARAQDITNQPVADAPDEAAPGHDA